MYLPPFMEGSLPCSQEPATSVTFGNKFFFYCKLLPHPSTPQAGGPAVVGCPRLFIQYIHSYPPYLEAVSSIHNLRTRCVMVTRDPLNMVLIPIYSELPSIFGGRLLNAETGFTNDSVSNKAQLTSTVCAGASEYASCLPIHCHCS